MGVLKNMLSLYKEIVDTLSYNQNFTIEQFEGQIKIIDPVDTAFYQSYKTSKKFFSFIKQFTGVIGILALALVLSPLLFIGIGICALVYDRLAKKMAQIKPKALKEINKLSFEEIKEFEAITNKFFKKAKAFRKDMESSQNIWPFRSIYKNLVSIDNDIDEMVKATEARYHFNMRELFSTEEEYQKYCEELKGLSDVWDYESSDEEMKLVFDLKKKNQQQ